MLKQPSWSAGFAPIAFVLVTGDILTTANALAAIEQYGSHRVRLFSVDTGNDDDVLESYVHYYLPDALQVPVETCRLTFEPTLQKTRRRIRAFWSRLGISSNIIADVLNKMAPTGVPFIDLALCTAASCTNEHTIEKLTEACLNATAFQATLEGVMVEIWRPSPSSATGEDPSWTSTKAIVAHRHSNGEEVLWRWCDPLYGWSDEERRSYLASYGILPASEAYHPGEIDAFQNQNLTASTALRQLIARNDVLAKVLIASPAAAGAFTSLEGLLIAAIRGYDEVGTVLPWPLCPPQCPEHADA